MKNISMMVCGTALCLPTLALSQTHDPAVKNDDVLTEIIVTASKREERLSDVPMSITAVSGDQLTQLGIKDPSDLTRMVPGFTFQQSSYGAPVFTIRGIGLYDTSVGIAPTVSVYVDQVPLPFLSMTSGASFDLERVEVLKGPQGTLFGQNSTGGAINYIAAKPTKDLHMGFDATYGRFNEVDAGGYVSGPLSERVRARVAVAHEGRDGWQISETRPGDTLGRRNFTNGRLLVDLDPSDNIKFELGVTGWQDKSETRASQFMMLNRTRPSGYPDSATALNGRAPAPDDPRSADWDADADLARNDYMHQLSARGDFKLGDQFALTSITAYSKYHAHTPTDVDGTSYRDFLALVNADVRSFSQELRVSGDLGSITTTGGLNYQGDHTDETRNGRSQSSNQGVGPRRWTSFTNVGDQQVKTYAAFGSLDAKVSPQVTLHAGGRYTKQNRDFQGCLQDPGDGTLSAAFALITGVTVPNGACVTIDSNTQAQPSAIVSSLDQNNFSWRAGIDYRPDTSFMVYANVSKGFKAGAYSPLPAINSGQLDPVTQESVLAYEAGLKANPFGSLLDVTGAVFYYQYDDKQILGTGIFPQFGALPKLVNVPKSNVLGGEIDLTLRPMTGLRLRGAATYVHSKVKSSFVTPDPFGTQTDIKGEAFPNTPKWQFVGSATYEFAVHDGLTASIAADANYRSRSNAAFGESPLFEMKAYSLVGMRAGLGSSDDRWRVELWGKNIFNTFYWENVSRNIDVVSRLPGMAATYGVTLRTKF